VPLDELTSYSFLISSKSRSDAHFQPNPKYTASNLMLEGSLLSSAVKANFQIEFRHQTTVSLFLKFHLQIPHQNAGGASPIVINENPFLDPVCVMISSNPIHRESPQN